MARKKFYTQHDNKVQKDNDKWRVALYIRLSREDGDKRESDSVVNQKKLLNYYIEQHEEFLSASTFVDENYTGTNFNRPEFQRMLSEIQTGNINCVIIKDLSRFGREHLKAGDYLVNVFPKHNCRFISIIDGIDTYENPDPVNDIMVWVKNMMHEYNSQRISASVRATKTAQQKAGKYIGTLAPFGYKKDPNDKHRLIVDEEIRPIIESIFRWHLVGMGSIAIAKKLNAQGIVTRSTYRKTGTIFNEELVNRKSNWKPNAITQILNNKVYMGAVAQHKKTTRNYKDRKAIFIDEDEQHILYDMHEAIIPQKIFESIQNRKKTACVYTSRHEDKLYPLSGLLRCKDCGYAMIRNPKLANGKWYVYYKCRAYNQRGENICNHSHSIKEELLFVITLSAINMHIQTLIDIKRLLESIKQEKKNINSNIILNFDNLIKEKNRMIMKLKGNKINCYNDWKDDVIDKADYIMLKDDYDDSIAKLSNEIRELEKEKSLQSSIYNDGIKWLNDIVEYGKITTLTRDIATSLIDRIYIDKDKNISIDFKFKNEYASLLEILSEYQNYKIAN